MVSEQIAQIVAVCSFASYGPAIEHTDIAQHMIRKILGIDMSRRSSRRCPASMDWQSGSTRKRGLHTRDTDADTGFITSTPNVGDALRLDVC